MPRGYVTREGKRYIVEYGPEEFTFKIWERLCEHKLISFSEDDDPIEVRYAELHRGGELKDGGNKVDFGQCVAIFNGREELIVPNFPYPWELTDDDGGEERRINAQRKPEARKKKK